MVMKAIFGAIGVILMTVFLGAIVVKVKAPALAVVIVVGLLLMAFDTWQSLGEKD